jgi:hypothetical protein
VGRNPLAINPLWGGFDVALAGLRRLPPLFLLSSVCSLLSLRGGFAGPSTFFIHHSAFYIPPGLARRARSRYVSHMSTREILLEEIKRQPEPVLLEVWHYLKFLNRQREEEAWADVLPSRQVEQEVLDQLDSK